MNSINDSKMLNFFIEKYELHEIFEEEIIHSMKLYSFEKGEFICRRGEKLSHLYFLVAGKLKVSTTLPNGKSLLLRFYKPLSIIGDIELLTEYDVRCDVECTSEATVIAVWYKDIINYSYNNPEFLRFIIKNLSHKIYTVSNFTAINLLYPVENRFASYLVSTALDECNSLYQEEIKTSKLTDIASLLGTSYRHLNRVIKDLVAKNIIKREKGLIVVKDIERLKELASGNMYE